MKSLYNSLYMAENMTGYLNEFLPAGSGKMKFTALRVLTVSLLLSGCSLLRYRNADIIDHPEPNCDYPDALISKTGCVSAGTKNDWDCGPKW